jgi:hypothetical protein
MRYPENGDAFLARHGSFLDGAVHKAGTARLKYFRLPVNQTGRHLVYKGSIFGFSEDRLANYPNY